MTSNGQRVQTNTGGRANACDALKDVIPTPTEVNTK
jgi:hypothetical protein